MVRSRFPPCAHGIIPRLASTDSFEAFLEPAVSIETARLQVSAVTVDGVLECVLKVYWVRRGKETHDFVVPLGEDSGETTVAKDGRCMRVDDEVHCR